LHRATILLERDPILRRDAKPEPEDRWDEGE
jgi:hypothetical protein